MFNCQIDVFSSLNFIYVGKTKLTFFRGCINKQAWEFGWDSHLGIYTSEYWSHHYVTDFACQVQGWEAVFQSLNYCWVNSLPSLLLVRPLSFRCSLQRMALLVKISIGRFKKPDGAMATLSVTYALLFGSPLIGISLLRDSCIVILWSILASQ